MQFLSMLMTMIQLFLMLLIGFICRKINVFSDLTQANLTKVILYVTMPCSLLNAILSADNPPSWKNTLFLLIIAALTFAFLFLVSWVIGKIIHIPKDRMGIYRNMMVFPNCLFMGIPVISALYGSDGLFYLAIFNIPYSPFIYTYGIYLMMKDRAIENGHVSMKGLIKPSTFISPCLISSILAIVIVLTGIQLPVILTDTISTLSGITSAGSLLCIGMSIAKIPTRKILGSPRTYLMSFARLIICPLLVWLVFRPFLSDPVALGVAVTLNAMPVGSMVAMLSIEYGGDTDSVVQGICVSTILSVITVPLLLSLIFR